MFLPQRVLALVLLTILPVLFGVPFGILVARRSHPRSRWVMLLIYSLIGVLEFAVVRVLGLAHVVGAIAQASFYWVAGLTAFIVLCNRGRCPPGRM